MPLRIVCPQGHTLVVSQARAGATLRCPRCESRVTVPGESSRREHALPAATKPATDAEPKIPAAAAAIAEEPQPPPVLSAVGDVEPPPIWTPPPKSRALLAAPQPISEEASPLALPPSPEQKAELRSEPVPPEPKTPPLPVPLLPPVPARQPEPPTPEPALITQVPPADNQAAAPTQVPPADEALALPEPVAPPSPGAEPPQTASPLLVPNSQQLGAFILSACLLAAALFGVAPAVWDVLQSFQTAEASLVARWALVVLALCIVQVAYAVYLAQLPDWTSGWVVTVFALASAALYAGLLGVTAFAGENSRLVHSLHLTEYVASGRAPIWCLCMTSIMATLAFFGGRMSLRWRQAEAF